MNYVFWSDPYELPNDNETLEYCEENNIGFMVATNENYLRGDNFKRIDELIDHNIEVSIMLVGKDFAHLDNSEDILDVFYVLRNCSFYKDIFEVYIDAEISKEVHEKVEKMNTFERASYWWNEYPLEETYEKAVKAYKELQSEIHNDEKDFGIIRGERSSNELDKTSRNVPFEELDPDTTIIMAYRSHENPIQIKNDYWFYQTVKKEEGEIFVGDFENGYEQFRKDLTICSFFEKKVVYIFEFHEFIKHYDLEDLKPLREAIVSYTFYQAYEYFFKFFFIEILNVIFLCRKVYIISNIFLLYMLRIYIIRKNKRG